MLGPGCCGLLKVTMTDTVTSGRHSRPWSRASLLSNGLYLFIVLIVQQMWPQKNIEIPLSAICIHNNYLLCITNDSWQVDRTKQSQVFLQQNLKTPSSPQLNFPSHCHINSDPNLRFSTNLCNCLEDRTPDQPLASTETEAAPVLRTQPPASLPEKAVSSARRRSGEAGRLALGSTQHYLAVSTL